MKNQNIPSPPSCKSESNKACQSLGQKSIPSPTQENCLFQRSKDSLKCKQVYWPSGHHPPPPLWEGSAQQWSLWSLCILILSFDPPYTLFSTVHNVGLSWTVSMEFTMMWSWGEEASIKSGWWWHDCRHDSRQDTHLIYITSSRQRPIAHALSSPQVTLVRSLSLSSKACILAFNHKSELSLHWKFKWPSTWIPEHKLYSALLKFQAAFMFLPSPAIQGIFYWSVSLDHVFRKVEGYWQNLSPD